MELHITGDPAADKLLSEDDFALLTGMLLDQQVTMESAFAGPEKIRTRIGSLKPEAVAAHGGDHGGGVVLGHREEQRVLVPEVVKNRAT